jgi:hypothetical protein
MLTLTVDGSIAAEDNSKTADTRGDCSASHPLIVVVPCRWRDDADPIQFGRPW